MKSNFNPSPENKRNLVVYPYLGISPKKGSVVLFTAPATGMVIWATKEFSVSTGFSLGHYSRSWKEPDFERLLSEEKVELNND